jgi:ABC-type glycerol-3-phosphate transport system substrate-binding protein
VLDLMKSQFEAANPNVKIEHWHMGSGGTSGPGGYTDVIVAQLLTRSGADAIANFSWGPHATHLIDLTRDAPAAGWKKEEMYFDEPNQTLDGKLYMLSMSASVTNWVYNKTIFKEAGLKEPDDTWTFDTVLEAAQKLTDPAKKQYGLFTPNQFERGYVDGMLAGGAGATSATTAEVFNLEQKKTRLGEAGGPDHFAWYIDAIYKHKVAPAPGEVPSLASGGITNPFAAGRIAMQPFGLYAAGDAVQQIGTRFEWAGMPTPKHQVTGNRATVLISEGFVLPKYTQARGTYETALKYALSFYGDPVMKAVAAGRGTLPVVRKWIKSTEYLNPPPGSMDIIVKTVEDPKIVMGNFNWNTKAWGPWRQAVRTELDRAFANDRPARDALAAAIKAGDEALAKS